MLLAAWSFVTASKSDEWGVLVDSVSDRQGSMASGVRHLVRVDRLKAIRVFQGFTRLGGKEAVPPDIVGRSDCRGTSPTKFREEALSMIYY